MWVVRHRLGVHKLPPKVDAQLRPVVWEYCEWVLYEKERVGFPHGHNVELDGRDKIVPAT